MHVLDRSAHSCLNGRLHKWPNLQLQVGLPPVASSNVAVEMTYDLFVQSIIQARCIRKHKPQT